MLGGALLLALGCGIGVRRDLSQVQPSAVVFDDLCGLQGYYDALQTSTLKPPTVAFSRDLERVEGKRTAGGRSQFLFDTDFQLEHLRRVLTQNWKRVPAEVMKAKAVNVEVEWAERAGTRRVVTDADASISVGKESWALPYHPCLSDLLFGEDLYKTRRQLLGLPPLPPSPYLQAARTPAPPDGGADARD